MSNDLAVPKDELMAIRNELRISEKLIETRLKPQMLEAVYRYTGLHVPKIAVDWTLVLNEIYPVIQSNLPSIFFRNPRVFLKPRNKTYIARKRNLKSGKMEDVILDANKSAKTQEAILNYRLEQINYKKEVRKVLLDALLFKHACLWHGYKGNFGMTDEKSIFVQNENVFVCRTSPGMMLWDPSVAIEYLDEGGWQARAVWMRLKDVLDDDDLTVTADLKGVQGYTEKVTLDPQQGSDTKFIAPAFKSLIDFAERGFSDSNHSRFIKLYEVFKRPSKKDLKKGRPGKILLMCTEQKEPLRKNIWEYKAEGYPGHLLQFNPVPEMQLGVSDVETYGNIADHKNLVINQQIRNAEQLNKVWVGLAKDGADEEDIEKARKGENTIIQYDTDDIQKKMFVASGGGQASSELYLLDQRIQRNLEDKSGVSDLKRGFLQSGEESAESVKIRSAGSNLRPAYRQDIMAEFLKRSCLYLNQLNKQYVDTKEAVRIVGSLDVEWSDTPTKEGVQADVDVEIDVISMAPENPEKELQEMSAILNLMVQAITTPEIYQKIQQEGKTFNLSPIIENMLLRLRVRDPEVFRNIKPEESQGFTSVAELRAAQQNVMAAMSNQMPPSPPEKGQDHRARLEVYMAISQLLKAMNQVSDMLEELIKLQAAILEEEEAEEGQQVNQPLKKEPFLKPVG